MGDQVFVWVGYGQVYVWVGDDVNQLFGVYQDVVVVVVQGQQWYVIVGQWVYVEFDVYVVGGEVVWFGVVDWCFYWFLGGVDQLVVLEIVYLFG